jgi:kynurenine 3-monooxygenase
MSEQIQVAGAGLAGSLLAVLLAKRGFKVTVFESRGDLRSEDVGAGRSINLALANRGIAALEGAAVMGHVREAMIPMRGRILHPVEGDLGFQPYGSRDHEVIYSISRAGLNAILMDAAEAQGVEIKFEHPVVSFDALTGIATVEDRRANTTFEIGGPIIGCDGAGSPIRKGMEAAGLCGVSEEKLAHSYKELNIPGDADGQHRMETEALHIWPRGGYMLIALPNVDGSFTVTLFLPDEGPISFDSIRDEQSVVALFEQQFPDALSLLPTLTQDFAANPTGFLGTIRTDRWYTEHALVLGDAAHAVVPFHGQGMNCAFEDCSALARCIDQLGSDWSAVFPEFEALRRANANAIADMALENYVVMRDSVLDPRFLIRKRLEFELERRQPERFIPRYSMVMFHHLPYAEAKARGAVQAELMTEIIGAHQTFDQIDVDRAETLVLQRLSPLDPSVDLGR